MRRKWALSLLTGALLLSSLAGCGSSSAPASTPAERTAAAASSTESAPASTAKPGLTDQVLKYGTDTWPAGFDPHTISAVAAVRVFGQVYETLLNFGPDLTLEPQLAESWETPDNLTYIFHVRKGVKFHNGREMTADDVKYSFDRVLGRTPAGELAGALGNSPAYFAGIDKIEVTDPYTVKFVLKQPNAAFLSTMTSSYGSIVCKEVAEKNKNSLSTMDTLCGTGPFKYKNSVTDNYISLVKNPDYWMEGQPKLEGITYFLMADEGARLAALKSGEIDLCSLSAMNLASVKGDSAVKVVSYQSNNYTFLGFNLSNKALQDKKVRQAMSMAVDRPAIIDYVYNGSASVSTFVPLSMGRWMWDASKESPLYKKDVAAAQKLMQEAGYSDSNHLKITMAAGLLDSIRDTAVVLQQQLKAIYVDVTITNLESAQYVDAWGKMNKPESGFDTMCGQNGSGTDPNRAAGFFYSTKGGANKWGYSNPQVDKLCEEGIATTDDAKRQEIYIQAQKLIVDDCPNLWLASPMEYFFVNAKVEGFKPVAANANNFRDATLK